MDKLILNPAGAYGGGVNDASFQLLFPFLSSDAGAITYGQCVSIAGALGARKTVLKATTGVAELLVIGITVEAIGIAEIGLVCIHGLVLGVAAEGAITSGAQVGRSGTTAGSVATRTSDAALIAGATIGLCIGTAAANLTDVYVRQV